MKLSFFITNCYLPFSIELVPRLAESKLGKDLCRDVKTAGRCRNKRTCRARHFLHPDSDRAPAAVPTGAEVRLDLVRMVSPVHFVARLRAVRHASGAVVEWDRASLGCCSVLPQSS